MVEEMTSEVWEALEEVVKDRPVLLNRAPTLHRLGIQAFYPMLVEGKAIKIHPLVCAAFNADFDGDQMAVHILLSHKARLEAEKLMLSTKNILSPSSGRPLATPSQDMVLGLYYMTKSRKNVPGEGLVFSSVQEVIYAMQHGQVDIQASIKVRMKSGNIVETTVGRIILFEALPEGAEIEWVNKAVKKKDIAKLVERMYKTCGAQAAVVALDKIKQLGFSYATLGGISLSMENIVIPDSKHKVVSNGLKEVEEVERLYLDGAITNGERYNKVIQVWAKATETVTNDMISVLENQDKTASANLKKDNVPFNPVFMMLDSGARGSKQQIRQLAAMRGLMATPSGEIMETPVLANFKEGLSVFEYFISTHGARKGLADTALKTADSGYLTRRLVDVSQDVVVTQIDCQTLGYLSISELRESGEVIAPLAKRVFGRIAAEDIKDPVSGKIIVKQGDLIDDSVVEILKDSAVTQAAVRSVLTCQSKRGICAKCYGMDLSTQKLVDVGTAVGIIAAQSIGEPGTQLTMRTFHVGGTASGLVEENFHKAKFAGKVLFKGVYAVKNRKGIWTVANRRSKIAIVSEDGRELEEFRIEYGTWLMVDDGVMVEKGQKIAEWDPFKVIMSERAGQIQFIDLIENVTYQEQFDETVGRSNKMILEKRDERRQPCIAVLDNESGELARYYLPTGAILTIEDGATVYPGDILAKLPREEKKTKDITGGLPRVTELFEARVPRDAAILSEVDGVVRFGGVHRGYRKIIVTAEGGETFEYNVPRNRHLNVEDGELVKAGDALTFGVPNAHDLLKILGPDAVQNYLVKEVQEIYTLQGVDIHDKHIETIVRQMLRKVRIVDAGDTNFVIGDRVDKLQLQSINKALTKEGKRVATAKPILMGITKASLGTESFISAASFQETTRVLTEAALAGQVDYLYGLKENIIIGKIIPAGTGVESFRSKYLGEDVSDFEKQAREEEMLEAGLDKISLK